MKIIISYKMLNQLSGGAKTMNIGISGMNIQSNCPGSQHAKVLIRPRMHLENTWMH